MVLIGKVVVVGKTEKMESRGMLVVVVVGRIGLVCLISWVGDMFGFLEVR